jgi:hypothetical protein
MFTLVPYYQSEVAMSTGIYTIAISPEDTPVHTGTSLEKKADIFSDIEAEGDDVAVLNDIFFALQSQA